MTPAESRARGCLLGLAVGDAVGMPALYHRSVGLGSRRDCLWDVAKEADRRRIYRHPMPFTVADGPDLKLCGTDDAEMAALTGKLLLEIGPPFGRKRFAGAWRAAVETEGTWLSVADRIALRNLASGLTPPASGGDNPAGADDAAVVRAIPIGLLLHRDPTGAARLAAELGSVTHGSDACDAAGAMAGLVARLVGGAPLRAAIDAMASQIAADSWLGRGMRRALDTVAAAPSLFAAIPVLCDTVANHTYSYGSIATETLPVACAIAASAASLEEAVSMAALIPKQSDSMPALAGAIMGAARGDQSIPAAWTRRVDTLRGILIPAVKGLGLVELANALISAGQRHETPATGAA